jgi:hypothetical protein
MTDRLSLTNALADVDIDRAKAERIATEIFDAIHDNVATKQDLQHLEVALRVANRDRGNIVSPHDFLPCVALR